MNLKSLRITSIITFILVIIINTLGSSGMINGTTQRDVSDSFPNLLAPASITFSIWFLIYVTMFTFCILFLFKNADKKTVDDSHKTLLPYFITTNILTILWTFAWHNKNMFLSMVIITIYMLILARIMTVIQCKDNYNKIPFIKTAFGIHFGWLYIATFANICLFLVSIGFQYMVNEYLFTVLSIIVITVLGLYLANHFKCVSFSLVIVWAFIGVIIKHITYFQVQYPIIIYASILSIFTILLAIAWIFKSKKSLTHCH